jgi:hypothetical protein
MELSREIIYQLKILINNYAFRKLLVNIALKIRKIIL